MTEFLKQALVDTTGLSRDALHVHIGLLAMLIGWYLLGSTRRLTVPWLLVLAAALVNEANDLRLLHQRTGALHWADSVHDVVNTMLWPTVILLVAGRFRSAFPTRRPELPVLLVGSALTLSPTPAAATITADHLRGMCAAPVASGDEIVCRAYIQATLDTVLSFTTGGVMPRLYCLPRGRSSVTSSTVSASPSTRTWNLSASLRLRSSRW